MGMSWIIANSGCNFKISTEVDTEFLQSKSLQNERYKAIYFGSFPFLLPFLSKAMRKVVKYTALLDI